MNAQQGWTNSQATLRRWQVMRQMAAASRSGERYARGHEIAEAIGCDGRQVADVFDRLESEGLAGTLPPTLAPGYTTEAMLLGHGVAQVEEWEGATGTTLRRSCSAALLSWLDSLPEEFRTTTEEFRANVRGSYFGAPFPETVVHAVVDELVAGGLVEAVGVDQDPLLIAHLTPLGRLVLSRFGGDVEAWRAASETKGGNTTISVSGSTGVNVANQSPGAQQTANVVQVAEIVENLAAALQQMMPTLALSEADEAQAHGYVAQLREVVEVADSDPGRARRVVSALQRFLLGATMSAAGSALLALTEQVLHALH